MRSVQTLFLNALFNSLITNKLASIHQLCCNIEHRFVFSEIKITFKTSQIIKKENPRKSPSAPPNSEMKDSIGYILTSFFLVIVFDAIVMATFVSLLPKKISFKV